MQWIRIGSVYIFEKALVPTCVSSGVDSGEQHVREKGVDVFSAEVAASVRQPGNGFAVAQQPICDLLDALLC